MKRKIGRPKRAWMLMGTFALSLIVIASVNSACNKKAVEQEDQAGSAEAGKVTMVEEGLNTFEGTVKLAYGAFLYIPEIVGFDVVLPSGIDTSGLEGKAVRLEGEFKREIPSVLAASRLDVREGERGYVDFFVKTGEEPEPPFFNQRDRSTYPALKLTTANAADAWEGKGRGKVFGKLLKQTSTEGGAQNDAFIISVSDDKGKLIGKILVDTIGDYANYCMQKLRLFDSFWFYLDIKNSVEAKTRARSSELFHADIVFAGLY